MAVAELQIIPHIPGLLDKSKEGKLVQGLVQMAGILIILFPDQAQLSASLEENNNMVQVFMVVRCYSCKTFQVHQVSKGVSHYTCLVATESCNYKG